MFKPGTEWLASGGNPNTTFRPGHPWRWAAGTSGNPGGVSKLRARFEAWFYSDMSDEETRQDAAKALKEALKKGDAWAHNIYWPRMLPPDSLNVKLSRGDDDGDEFDYTKLSDAQLEQLTELLELARRKAPAIAEGEVSAEPEDVR